jgi:hypothetical protein
MKSPEQQSNMIEIRDTALDQAVIREQIAEAIASREYIQDVAQVGPERLHPGNSLVSFSSTETLNRLMLDLMAREPLHEHPFSSEVPLIGPLIVIFRRAWNWVSTRWYVLPIMQQQAEINRQMLLVLNELAQRHELDARRIAELETRLLEENK